MIERIELRQFFGRRDVRPCAAIGRLDEAVGILEGLDTEVVEDIEEDLEAMRNSSKRLDAYVAAVPAVQPAQDESA